MCINNNMSAKDFFRSFCITDVCVYVSVRCVNPVTERDEAILSPYNTYIPTYMFFFRLLFTLFSVPRTFLLGKRSWRGNLDMFVRFYRIKWVVRGRLCRGRIGIAESLRSEVFQGEEKVAGALKRPFGVSR